MPLRKEVKEAVVYPPSKRKAPPFKPQRPNKLVRTSTNDSETSDNAQSVGKGASISRTNSTVSMPKSPAQKKTAGRAGPSKTTTKSVDLISDSDISEHDDSDDLPDDPLKTKVAKKVPAVQKKAATKASTSNTKTHQDNAILEPDVVPPDIDEEATIPQKLLLRLLHENFVSQDTKIDKHAIAVLQQYVDLFVRETVARAAVSKKTDVENGRASQSETNWLEREDLEKVAGGMLMDF